MSLALRHSRLPHLLIAGIAIFLLALSVARMELPEWRQGSWPEPSVFEERFAEAARALGLETEGELGTQLASRPALLREAYLHLGDRAPAWLVEEERTFFASVWGTARWPDSPYAQLSLEFSGRGTLWTAESLPMDWSSFMPFNFADQEREDHRQALLETLARPSAPRGEAILTRNSQSTVLLSALLTEPPQAVSAVAEKNWVSVAHRHVGPLDAIRASVEAQQFSTMLLGGIPLAFRFIAVATLFTVLALKRRLGWMNAALLALAVLGLGLVSGAPELSNPMFSVLFGGLVLLKALFIFLLWASAESWIRSTMPGFSTSLDALRSGRLGPRGGRALLGGWALGAVKAGVGLLFFALAARLPGLYPEDLSLPIPVFGPLRSPLGNGVLATGFALLALALCRNLLPARWVAPTAVLLATLLNLPQVLLAPWPFALFVSLCLNAILIFTFHRYGLTGILTAALVSEALPVVFFTAAHLSWMPATFAVTALFSAAVPVLGFLGVSRPEDSEKAGMLAPAYIRRLEEERRIRYEMDLLARMQKGLLPETIPDVAGYQLAAVSILANEAGGDLYDFLCDENGSLWLATGDVSGHGLSCTIEHAMTKAALTSLVKAGRRPSEILHEVDCVLRTARSVRSFTSLSLLRLEPATGRIVFSNAGHPYPLLLDGQDLSEISLPSLPLGQGPQREYCDQSLVLRRGSVLVLLSDGLFESTDAAGRAYGYPRTRRKLTENVHRTAQEILDALLDDWRRHIGPGSPADDTTLVVLKREVEDGCREIPAPLVLPCRHETG